MDLKYVTADREHFSFTLFSILCNKQSQLKPVFPVGHVKDFR